MSPARPWETANGYLPPTCRCGSCEDFPDHHGGWLRALQEVGFQEVDSLTFDTLPHGGDKTTTWLCMRQPKSREA